ncbi:MAG TPA: RNA polymerase factor sigma-54 [Gammaproteobacteria bacterium]
MKPSLQLRLGQQLAMTPQLRQAIRLLQLSMQELQQEVHQVLEANVMLLADDGNGDSTDSPEDTAADSDVDSFDDNADFELDHDGLAEDWPETASADSWQDPGYDPMENMSAGEGGLREHLLWQIRLSRFDSEELAVAEAIADGLNDDGYLTESLDDICHALNVDDETGERVLHRIQAMDPPGVGARDLPECLSAQLRLLPPSPERDTALNLVQHGLELLARADAARLAEQFSRPVEHMRAALDLIRGLNPKPGTAVAGEKTEYVVPDALLVKREGRWKVELNNAVTPRLKLNEEYARLLRQADSRSPQIQAQLQEARWLIRSLSVRNDTLTRVSQAIVDRQQKFFDEGETAMSPLVLRDIATEVELHESTVSRVTANKYLHTHRGTLPLKYFFSSQIPANDGGRSSIAVRALIRKLIDQENPRRPLSDQKIAAILIDEGIRVARRTVTKYRESMRIPASYDRKGDIIRRPAST